MPSTSTSTSTSGENFRTVDSRYTVATTTKSSRLYPETTTSAATICGPDPADPCPPAPPPLSPPRPPFPPPTYDKSFHAKGDPAVNRARAIYLKAYLSGLFLVLLAIFAVFPIYWGSLWKVPAHSFQGWVVDFDGGTVGQSFVQDLTNASYAGPGIVHWLVRPPSDFPNGRADILNALKEDQVWVAVVINEGASSRLIDAITTPDAAYNGSGAITAYGVEARNENAYRVFLRPIMQNALDDAKLRFATHLASNLSTSTSSPTLNFTALLATSPQTLVAPVSYTLVNLIPFNQPVASAVVFVGLIYLLILSFFIVMIAHGAREASGLNRLLRLRSLVIVRIVSSCFGYFLLSFFYSLLNLAFKLDLDRRYGHSGFVLFWMLNWVGMLAVGLALEALITILTPKFIPFFMILWIIANVSVCIFPIDVLPRIFHYGYAMPFYNISNSIRSIAFGTRNTLGLNFGVLLAWVFVSCLTLPILQWFVRRQEMKAAAKAKSGPAVQHQHSRSVNEKHHGEGAV